MVEGGEKSRVREVTDQVNVTARGDHGFFCEIARKALEKFEVITLNAVGQAIQNAVISGQSLVK